MQLSSAHGLGDLPVWPECVTTLRPGVLRLGYLISPGSQPSGYLTNQSSFLLLKNDKHLTSRAFPLPLSNHLVTFPFFLNIEGIPSVQPPSIQDEAGGDLMQNMAQNGG